MIIRSRESRKYLAGPRFKSVDIAQSGACSSWRFGRCHHAVSRCRPDEAMPASSCRISDERRSGGHARKLKPAPAKRLRFGHDGEAPGNRKPSLVNISLMMSFALKLKLLALRGEYDAGRWLTHCHGYNMIFTAIMAGGGVILYAISSASYFAFDKKSMTMRTTSRSGNQAH